MSNKSKILYIDPNKYLSYKKYGKGDFDNVPVDMEDLSIGVNLTVRIPDRDSCGQTDLYSINWKNPNESDKVSFFEGTDGMLTDKYATITYTDILNDSYKQTKECLGIKDITISYNSYFYPEVTINFTDIRGNSLMSPNDINYRNTVINANKNLTEKEKKEKLAPTQENFFSALFSFPYPMFFLTVKGFYGLPVQFQLAVSDFRSSFNNQTGNFDATVKFIGYMYGIYTDIPMSYLICAPYCRYGSNNKGENIWEQNDYKFDDGTQIPKLLKMKQDLMMASLPEGVTIDTSLSSKYEKYRKAVNELQNIKQRYFDFRKSIDMNQNGIYCGNTNDYFSFIFHNTSLQLKLDNSLYSALINSVERFNLDFGDIVKIPYPNGNSEVDSSVAFKNKENYGCRLSITPYQYNRETNRAKGVTVLFRNFSKAFNVKPKSNPDTDEGNINDLKSIDNRLYSYYFRETKKIYLEEKFTEYLPLVVWDCTDFILSLNSSINSIKDEIVKISDKIRENYEESYSSVLGYKLNIKNIIQIIMAHMETFMGIMFKFMSNVKIQNRNASQLGINLKDTDISSNGKDSFVSPFPLIKDFDKKIIYPELVSQLNDIEEVKLIDSFLESSKTLVTAQQEFEKIESFANNVSFLPTNITDFITKQNPYEDIFNGESQIIVDELMSVFGNRLIKYHMFEGNEGMLGSIEDFGKAEAYNFWIKNRFLSDSTISLIKDDNFSSENFVDFMKGKKCCYIENGKPYYSPYKYLFWDKDKYSKGEFQCFLTNSHFTKDALKFSVMERSIDVTTSMPTTSGSSVELKDKKVRYDSVPIKDLVRIRNSYDDIERWGNKISNITVMNGTEIPDTKCFIDNMLGKKYHYMSSKNNGIKSNSNEERPKSSFSSQVELYDSFNEYDSYSFDQLYQDSVTDFYVDSCNMISSNVSIFSHPSYYLQGDNNVEKAFLFLSTLPFNVKEEEEMYNYIYSLERGRNIVKVPKLILLYIGSLIAYRNNKVNIKFKKGILENRTEKNFYDDTPMFFFDEGKEKKAHVKSEINNPNNEISIYSSIILNMVSSTKDKKNVFERVIDVFTERTEDEQGNVNYTDNLGLMKMFLNWANDNAYGFKAIRDELELCFNDSLFEFNTLDEIIRVYKGIMTRNVDSSERYINVSRLLKNVRCNLKFPNPVETYDEKSFNIYDMINELTFNKLSKSYKYIQCNKDGAHLGINPSCKGNVLLQNLYKDMKLVIVPSANILPDMLSEEPNTVKNFGADILVKGFDKFKEQLLFYYQNSKRPELENIETSDKGYDFKLSMYLTLKNLYDRWLSGENQKKWDISNENGEFRRFSFIDSFYNDIGETFKMNGEQILNVLDIILKKDVTNSVRSNDISLYSFISMICQKNNMLFLALPIFNGTIDKAGKNLKNMFTPMSYNDSTNMDDIYGPSYVCIYPHKPSEHLDLNSKYTNDSFDIPSDPYISGEDMADTAYFSNETLPEDLMNMDEGNYVIPSFSVDFAKQNQNFFKNITVNMDNPQVTEYSMAAQFNIANMTEEAPQKIQFEGQDLYKIYSNHSYTCTVEMMGCAQIQPLMYFQLNNIPMFHGAYMVIKVEHSITSGNMITKFTGVRLSKNKIPMIRNNESLSNILDSIERGDIGSSDSKPTIVDETISPIDDSINKVTMPDMADDLFSYDLYTEKYRNFVKFDPITTYTDNDKKASFDRMNYELRKAVNEITESFIKTPGNGIVITSMTRNKGKRNSGSDHSVPPKSLNNNGNCVSSKQRIHLGLSDKGCAIDMIGYDIETGRKDKSKKSIDLFNFIAVNYTDNIRQLLWESSPKKGTSTNEIGNCIHYSTYGKGKNDKCDIFQTHGEGFNIVRAECRIKNGKPGFPINISPSFVLVMNNIIEKNPNFDIRNFKNFINVKGFSKEIIKEWANSLLENNI